MNNDDYSHGRRTFRVTFAPHPTLSDTQVCKLCGSLAAKPLVHAAWHEQLFDLVQSP